MRDGQNPHAGLVFDSSGNLYGTTVNGGMYNSGGTAFELSPAGGGGWTESFLYSFGNGTDGANPYAGLIFDNSGNLYGTTGNGGLYSGGTVFELSPISGASNRCCREIVVYNFGANAADGQNPHAGLVFDSSGNLYGTTVNGGVKNLGTVFGIRPTNLQFVPVTSCRLVDTRLKNGGGGPIQGGTFDTFNLPQAAKQSKGCPMLDLSSAAAYSLNVTVVPQGPLGYLTIWPAGQNQPKVSTLNSLDGRVKANAAIIPAGVNASVSVFASNTTDVILDIDGYFAAPGNSTLAFYPLTPCRVADTRHNNRFGLGAPFLHGQVQRRFPVPKSDCKIPRNARAYSFNFTAVPHEPLGYLTVWPTGQPQPVVSTLNAPTGTVVANAAIVPAGVGGDIEVFASNDTDLAIDVNGYFAAPGQNGLSLYPVVPCRVLDTRQVGNGQPFVNELTVNVVGSVCAPPSTAQAYVFNATVVPSFTLGYLTLWPDGSKQPNVSTLNALDGAVTSNMAIVPATNGSIDAFASNLTQLILDISSYFAPSQLTRFPK